MSKKREYNSPVILETMTGEEADRAYALFSKRYAELVSYPPMSQEEYSTVQTTISLIATLLLPLDLKRFIAASDQAKSTMPVTNPTVYNEGLGRLLNPTSIAIELTKVQEVVRRDIFCVCGHGFLYHRTPGTECIHTERIPDNDSKYCQCDNFVLDRSEY